MMINNYDIKSKLSNPHLLSFVITALAY